MASSSKYSEFIDFLQKGKICVFETDTVVGLGCKVFIDNKINPNIQKIYEIKNRDTSKKLPWLISSQDMLNDYAININNYGKDYIENYWPGAITLIFEVNSYVSNNLLSKNCDKKNSIAFRIPDCEEIINAIDFIGGPVVCTSANLSNQDPCSDIKNVDQKILQSADYVYEKKLNKTAINTPSQIISCLGDHPEILR